MSKAGLAERVRALNLNPEAIERVEVFLGDEKIIIPNVEGRKLAMQVYTYIATNDGWIGAEEAKKGLSIFGDWLIQEARKEPEKHPNVYNLAKILESESRIRVNVIRKLDSKPLPDYLSEAIAELAQETPTPFYIYDERAIREKARHFMQAFSDRSSGIPGFKNYFAVKALPNPFILKILKEEGMGADCSSFPELILAERAGIIGENIMFTSNDTPPQEFVTARDLGAMLNLDDFSHIDVLKKVAGIPPVVCFRYNPGPLREGNAIIGRPEEAKYGLTHEQLFEAYKRMKAEGVKRFGLHTMIASNELNPQYFVETTKMLFDLVVEISKTLGITFEFVNLGGGIGIPYKPEQRPVDLATVGQGIADAYERIIAANDLTPLKVFMECGRMVTGPHGFLVSRVLHKKDTYKQFVGLDACMANLMRPALYGAYHHITVLGKENIMPAQVYDVTGGLCENNDKFAINRPLPEIDVGDLVVIHDCGAHGWAMGFQYNGKLRSAEWLLGQNGELLEIRRAETPDDYLATLDFGALKAFS